MDPLWIVIIGFAMVVGGILVLRLHAFLALAAAALIVAAITPADAIIRAAMERKLSREAAGKVAAQSVGERVAREFGNTAGKIGLLIAMASIIGKCLLESGAADRIVRSALRFVGERAAPAAFLATGFLLGVPVYFDTVFFLMIPLARALSFRTGRNYGLYIMSIIAGGSMAHSLVPPTPGPLFVATELGVDIGHMILAGMVVSVFASSAGFLYAVYVNRRWPIPLRDSADTPLARLELLSQRNEADLPPLWLALLPIVLPVLLIGGNAIAGSAAWPDDAIVRSLLGRLGEPNLALTLAAGAALVVVMWQKRQRPGDVSPLMQAALTGAGLIILITSAGGAFGAMLQQTGIGGRIKELAAGYEVALLPLSFLVTTLVRTAQGSATVAMITTVGILANIATPHQLGFHPVYLALAIGCGSKPFPWMNDSGFWVIGKMSGMTERETFRAFSGMISVAGVAGLLAVMLLAKLFPLL